jgi:membrane-associated phospholipid phosphatase
MKRLVFDDYPRPSKFFEKNIDLHVIEGLELHSFFSFPSGHSSGAFAVFFILGMFSRNIWITVLCFMTAVFVALSRVYLMQHFLIDVYAGGIIGVVVSFIIYYIFERKSNLHQNPVLNKPLLKAFKK